MLRIIKLKADDVHGYIPLNLKFDDKLTFLTGSNGCGKTTALKLISAMLQPDLELINSIEFTSVNLEFSIENKEFEIVFNKVKDKNENDNIVWTIAAKNLRKVTQIEIPNKDGGTFKLFQKNQRTIYNREELLSIRETIYHEFINSNYFKIIQNISTPVFLGIDRKILGTINQFDRKTINSMNNSNSVNERSFHDAQRVIIDYVSAMADKKKEKSEGFKTNIFKSLFEYVSIENKNKLFNTIPIDKLETQKRSVLNSIQKLDLGEGISESIENYYNSIIEIQPKVFNNEKDYDKMNEWYINRTHLHRIEAISKHAEKFQKEVDKLDKPINEIIRLTNNFFKESNKSLRINPSGFINVIWADRNITTRNLSSGEMQIIVLITHLVFCEHRKESSVFVIDEPELSLHLSWQEKFVDAILEASPSTQFILATHSPAIIANFEYEQKAIYIKNI